MHRKAVKERQLADGRGGGAKSYDREKSFNTLWVGRYFFPLCVILKGLSHEKEFKSFDKNLQNLAYLRDAAGF
jgi:hypothetical protein